MIGWGARIGKGQAEILLFSRVRIGARDQLPTQRIAALLAYLALRNQWTSRETVAEAIWPEMPDGNALASLRNALSVLRKLLPEGAIESSRTEVRLSPDVCACDVWDFRKAAQQKDIRAALNLYESDLAPELYDGWLDPYRNEVRSQFITLATEAADQLSATRDPLAIDLAKRWRSLDPYEIQPLVAHARSLIAFGRKEAALSEIADFEKQYEKEFQNPNPEDLESLRNEVKTAKSPRVEILASTLPRYLTRFFGRQQEVNQIQEWLRQEDPLMTIAGPGGVGKTRLAVEAIANAAKDRRAVFINLAEVRTADAVNEAMVEALGLQSHEPEPNDQRIERFLKNALPHVLILDNLEQLGDQASTLITKLVTEGPDHKFLTTSRHVLNLGGERVLRLTPLKNHPAVQMFLDRAKNARSEFDLTDANQSQILGLCEDVEGMPLAIEIVAAWSGTLSPAQMRSRMSDEPLETRNKDHAERHRTLEACIDWSYQLLTQDEQTYFTILSMFSGGFTLEAATFIAENKKAEEMLATLVDRSLVVTLEVESGLRFRMLESIRSFAGNRLSEQTLQSTAPRFTDYFRDLAVRLSDSCVGEQESINQRALERERQNIEAAVEMCERGLTPQEPVLAMLGSMHLHWVYRGQLQAGINLINRVLAVSGKEKPSKGLFMAQQTLSVLFGDIHDLTNAERAIEQLQVLADRMDSLEFKFRALTQFGNFNNRRAEWPAAESYHRSALAVADQIVSPDELRFKAVVHCNLAEALFGQDRLEEAFEHWRLAADFDLASGNKAGEARLYLGFSFALTKDLGEACRSLAIYLQFTKEIGFAKGIVRGLHASAYVAGSTSRRDMGRRWLHAAEAYAVKELVKLDPSN